jgi:hypothetical protein
MQIDYKKKHIETEKKFYQKMDKTKTFLLTLIIVGVGCLFLYIQYWSIEQYGEMGLWIWTLVVGILFLILTLIGYSMFEYERKKYLKN